MRTMPEVENAPHRDANAQANQKEPTVSRKGHKQDDHDDSRGHQSKRAIESIHRPRLILRPSQRQNEGPAAAGPVKNRILTTDVPQEAPVRAESSQSA